jgi:RNAse (barnase) inhibitor barstar
VGTATRSLSTGDELSITNNSSPLCDACGARLGNDRWYCKNCNAYFCNKCGKYFAYQQSKTQDPFCPACWVELQLNINQVLTFQPISDEKVLNYIKSTNVSEIRNKKDLFDRLSRLLNIDQDYVEDLWSKLEKRNPALIDQITSKFKDEMLRKHYERMQFEALHPKNEPKSESFSEEESKPVKLSHENKIASIKDVKPIDGLEFDS